MKPKGMPDLAAIAARSTRVTATPETKPVQSTSPPEPRVAPPLAEAPQPSHQPEQSNLIEVTGKGGPYNVHFTDELRAATQEVVKWRTPNLTFQSWILEAILEKADRELTAVPEAERAQVVDLLKHHRQHGARRRGGRR